MDQFASHPNPLWFFLYSEKNPPLGVDVCCGQEFPTLQSAHGQSTAKGYAARSKAVHSVVEIETMSQSASSSRRF